jgi:Sec7-like guanine-nucleotide exchange factor
MYFALKHAQAANVDKTALGIFFAQPDAEDTLKNYLLAMKFTGLTVDEALRAFLGRFQLPAEAQLIDR